MKARPRPPAERLEDILLGPSRLQAVYVAVRLGIPDMLHDGPRSSTLLASTAGVHPGALHRLLRFLVADGFFELSDDGRFSPTPLSDALTMDAPGGHRQKLLNTAMRTWDTWREVLYSVETGRSAFERVHGTSYADDQARNAEWLARNHSASVAVAVKAIAHLLPSAGTVVAFGMAAPDLLTALAAKSDGITGIACDRPSLGEWARKRLEPVAERVTFLGGDPLECVPEGGALYILHDALRDRTDEDAPRLVQACQVAMAPGARLALLESVLPDDYRKAREEVRADLELLLTSGGRIRTLSEYRLLLEQSGLRVDAAAVHPGGRVVIEASKGLF